MRPRTSRQCVLALNAGSSTIRFGLYEAAAPDQPPRRLLAGKVDRRGGAAVLTVTGPDHRASAPIRLRSARGRGVVVGLLAWLESQPAFASIAAAGHRVVHGMAHSAPERITPRLLRELRRMRRFDPEHLPLELELMTVLRARHPRLRQVACFDTAFHRTMPRVARLLPIPRRYAAQGVMRYGFHGLSYAHLMERLRALSPPAANGRVILAHLGHGASIAAVRAGESIDTSMGFTPAAGLVMGTRSGDLDPGLLSYLARSERATPARFDRMINHESGLLGISATSGDMRDLLAAEAGDPRAAEAVALFCYQAKKWIGAYAAALGGVDVLVFSGGIGEHSPSIRARICAGLGFLGIAIDARRNGRGDPLISTAAGRVQVRVIQTDEEVMIAKLVFRHLGHRS